MAGFALVRVAPGVHVRLDQIAAVAPGIASTSTSIRLIGGGELYVSGTPVAEVMATIEEAITTENLRALGA